MTALAIDTARWRLTGITRMPLLATFVAGSWSAAVRLKVAIPLAIKAADRVGDVNLNPDLHITNLQCFGGFGGIEGQDKGAGWLPYTLPYH